MRGQSYRVTPHTITNTAASVILDTYVNRVCAVIFNETGTLFVKYGPDASQDSYTHRLTANTEQDVLNYTGLISAIRLSGSGRAMVTEIW